MSDIAVRHAVGPANPRLGRHMNMNSSPFGSIDEMSGKIAAGLSPVEIMEGCLERIREMNEHIRAMIFVNEADALEAALQATREIRSGHARGPLHGVPIAVKDVLDVKHWPTTAGSRLFENHIAQKTAVCVANLQAAGAIIIGKTNLHELCVGGHDNPWYGKVANPLDPDRGTGGTSSGSAAAVAAGFCLAAVGTDSGGSNRSPAAATGLFGYKPTNGLIAMQGVMSIAPSLDCVGVLARSVRDVRLVTEALAGKRLTPSASGPKNSKSRSSITVGICPELIGAPIDKAVDIALAAMLDRPEVHRIEIAFDDREAFVAAGLTILQCEFARTYRDAIERKPDLVGDAVRSFLQDGTRISADAYAGAIEIRNDVRSRFLEKMAGVDALAIPTAPGAAPCLSDELTEVNGEMVPWGMAGGRFRRWANMLGMPTLAIPVLVPDGLPVSVQLAAHPGQDSDLLDLAEMLTSN
ncbi:amidase [Mesorhizobium sp. XAP10]|uniref:amidase n=1 Tax=unclassified Mesorhizobium TaxID=325217 RepID=UPI0023DFE425|nr:MULTISPECIES: amidase [unclassified Mesorhizobium]MDF3154648.1 amidase [Mesorhizobium sp. XAP10]MDF3247802.1 amidase [Mesorhizobium sp. XAP4]